MTNTIDRVISLLQQVHLPPAVSAGDYQQTMQELMLLKARGVMENSYGCPAVGCNYVVVVPPHIGSLDDPPVCPSHSCPLVILTARQMMHMTASAMKEQAEVFQAKVDEVVDHIGRVDDAQFLSANEREELIYLRELYASPVGSFSVRMAQEIHNNSYKGEWGEWKPDWEELVYQVVNHLESLSEARDSGNKLAVSEYAADIGNYMLKAIEMYGQ